MITSVFLIVKEVGKDPVTHTVVDGAILGRGKESHILIAQEFVSRSHLQFFIQDERIAVMDMGSTNGIVVNSNALVSNTTKEIFDDDVLIIGDDVGNSLIMTLQVKQDGKSIGKKGDAVIEEAILSYAQIVAEIELSKSPDSTVIVGREESCDIHLPHSAVSREHTKISKNVEGHFVIEDMNSANGTFLNRQLVVGTQLLKERDQVQIGPYKLVFENGRLLEYSPEGNFRLDAIDLDRDVNIGGGQTKAILTDISLSVLPREFVALVGGSGAGKSTLIKALSGFSPADGNVLVNGDNLYENFGAYRTILGYVPQDDILHDLLTVEEALTYTGRLQLEEADDAEIDAKIETVLKQVEMDDHRGTLIQRLSGGQRKRVSIAAELLGDPGLFFLDEPTSGLDPGLEKKMMRTLRELADNGQTVILITHATVNITECTHVAFLADGRMVYFGPPDEAPAFFGTEDFADIYSSLSAPAAEVKFPEQWREISSQLIQESPELTAAQVWEQVYRHSYQYRQYVAARLDQVEFNRTDRQHTVQTNTQHVSLLDQFKVLSSRYISLIRRDRLSLIILLAVMPVIGLLLLLMANQHDLVGESPDAIRELIQESIGVQWLAGDPNDTDASYQRVYQVAGDAERVVFMLSLAAGLLGLFAGAYEIVKEAAIYQRERLVNLKIFPYLSSKLVVLFAFALVQCLLLLGVLALKIDYPSAGVFMPAFLEMYITLALATLASLCLGLFISSLVRHSGMVIYAILVIVFLQIMFSGAIFTLPAAGEFISWGTTTRWTLEALGTTVDLEGLRDRGGGCLESSNELMKALPETGSPYCEDGQLAIDADYDFNLSYTHTTQHLFSRWGILFGFSVLFMGLTFVTQKRKDEI
ncbi:MAG: ABC-type multidrug transport system ATPase subunit/pSer/pThr [Candidatus Promineifilaceae bacterium]|jgi:ABC-type multidrug transport system ATPase subunit/pSer/pThr/pTyr-binding forkhead associated (FHA) protein